MSQETRDVLCCVKCCTACVVVDRAQGGGGSFVCSNPSSG